MTRPHATQVVNRAGPRPVALETTLLAHGVPTPDALPLADRLESIVREHDADPATIGLVRGVPTVGMNRPELEAMLAEPEVPKANTSNLGVYIHRRSWAATTVSATMEVAAAAGVRLFATGGLGGVHRNYATDLDISADLAAFTRFPVAVVCSGVKSLLDVAATREALETLGIPVVGYRTDRFPAFYLRETDSRVDARFDDAHELASFAAAELARTSRGIVIANPVPPEAELDSRELESWIADASARAADQGITSRRVTPFILARLHEFSKGATLRANIALIESNTHLAAMLAAAMPPSPGASA